MEFKFKLQKTPHSRPDRTQKAQKPSSLTFVNVSNPKEAKDKATLQKVRRHVMKDIGRSRRSRPNHDLTAAKSLYQVGQAPTYWGDVQVCVNVKRVFWAMEMVSGTLLSITIVDPAIRDRQKITRRQDEPPSLEDIEQYTQSLGTVRKSILAESLVRQRAMMGTVICLAVFDMRVGNLSSWTMHMAGLQMILDLTGGLEALDSTSALRQALFLADLFGSLKQDISPKFPLLHLQFEPQATLSPYTQRLVKSLEELQLPDHTPIVNIRYSFAYASRVAALLNKQWAENPTDSSFVLPTCSLAHQALCLPRWDLITEEGTGAMAQLSALAELVRIATVSLFCIIVSQTSGDLGYIIPRRDVPFQYLMSLIDDRFWDGKRELKLWLLVNQFCVEAGSPRIWYLEQLVNTMSQGDLWSWQDLMSSLQEVIWVEGLAPLEMSELRLYMDKRL
ncbi:hypothetical protein FSHL1_012396 [Fusarium sambucinum]